MSFFLVSEGGYVGELASINGFMEMVAIVKSIKPYGYLADFVNDGQTTDISEVINEIDQVIPEVTMQSVKSTLEELKLNLGKAKEIAIISQ